MSNGSTIVGAPVNGVNGTADLSSAERDQLAAELADARRQLALAQERFAARDAAIALAIRNEVSVSREELADIERRHREAMEQVRASAVAEAERILAGARRRAADLAEEFAPSIPPSEPDVE